ncbi:MAG: acyl-CoA dehydrogenase family protein, partial [Rhizobiaceae bacterium]
TQAARAICYACAMAIDNSKSGDKASFWADRGAFLTPLAKSFATDISMEVASLGVQVHGGMGFIEETGAARFMRDARILPIYEGTNGVQAIDLVTRKLPLGNGTHVQDYVTELRGIAEAVRQSNLPGFGTTASRIDAACDDALAATAYLQDEISAGRTNNALSGATPYQRLLSLTAGGAYLAKGALNGGDSARIGLCRFYAENVIAETDALKDRVLEGAQSLLDTADLVLA